MPEATGRRPAFSGSLKPSGAAKKRFTPNHGFRIVCSMQKNPPTDQATRKTQVSLVIPVYNEEANLPILMREIAEAMERQARSWQVLFVDDDSRDNSLQAIRALAASDERVEYISFASNKGQSAAFAAGFQEAQGETIVTLDSDLQNNPADIPAMLELFDQGYDMVIGWREKRQDSRIKLWASKFANAVRNRLSHETVRDTGCSLKVLRASMAQRIPMFTGMHRFLPTLMKMQGASVAEMPVSHRPRLHGTSKYGILDRAFSAFYDLLAVRWMQRRSFLYEIKERKK